MDLTKATGQVAGHITSLFGSVFRAGAYLAVLLFAAVYLAAQPQRYRHGVLRLVSPQRRKRIDEVLDLIGATLRRWLVGQSITMAVVGTSTALGLWGLGIEAPVALGLVAGMFAFIPYVGPVLASAPGILMAATQGPVPALYAAALYGGVHFVEGNVITPLVQAEAVELPPVMTLFATLVFGVLLGPVGVLLAAPLTVVLLVAVNALYLEDVLGEPRAWPTIHDRGHDG
jgi:predicted PurR-regulated permease PerM